MKRLFFVLALLLALSPLAQAADFLCLPNTPMSPMAEGSKLVNVVTDAGKADGYWCPTGTPKGSTWTIQHLIVLNKYAADPSAMLRRVVYSTDLLSALNVELNLSITPVAGSVDEFDYKTLEYRLCKQLIAKPYIVPMVDPAANYCGAEPTQPVAQYVTPSAGVSYTIYKAVNSKISSIVSGKKATPGATCDCSTSIISGSSTYCALTGGTIGEVTQCVKVK